MADLWENWKADLKVSAWAAGLVALTVEKKVATTVLMKVAE